jgi:phage repressor protein C with HTH and peptisase S24 domain
MEATSMKLVGVISTAVLSLTLGVAAPAFAQEQQEEKAKPAQQEEKAKPVRQEKQKAQPAAKQEEKGAQQQQNNAKQEEKNSQQQEKNTKQEEKSAQQQQHTQQARPQQQQQRAENKGSNRIPDDRFKAHFGREHSFRVSQGDYRNHRFQYGGYSFGFVDAWPNNWLYTQDVYVIEIDGVYYLCNPMYPGVNLVLSFES